MPVGAVIGAGVVGAGASLVGGVLQSNATNKATDVQKQMFDTTQRNLAPYLATGADAANKLTAALPSLTAPITMDEATLEATPGYQFNLTQGLKSVQNSAAARGLGTSGAALKGAANYATGLADSTYQQQFANANTNKLNAYNFLTGAANFGSNAAGTSAFAATTTGANIGANTIAGGTALAAGTVGAANSLTNAANTVGGYNYANKLLQQGYMPAGMYRAA